MRNDLQLRSDVDYAAYLFRRQVGTLEDAVSASGLSPDEPGLRTIDPGYVPYNCIQRPRPTDYFAFYQENGRWAWRRVNDAGSIVEASSGRFRHYLECVADAKQHGWNGKPIYLFAVSGFSHCGDPAGVGATAARRGRP